MANISSFFGTLYLSTNDKPWTPEGYLLAYDVLMSQDCSDGTYGFTISDEDVTADSASFLVECLKSEPDASFPIWGSGRWAAASNFDSFDHWSSTKRSNQTMSNETYEATRNKLLNLMCDNGWCFQFEYVDEEGGMGFIMRQTVTINVQKNPSTSDLEFISHATTDEAEDYTIDAYCRLVEEQDDIIRCDMFGETSDSLRRLMNINDDDRDKFEMFLIEKEYHFKLPPYGYYENPEDLPEGLTEEWKEYCNAVKE